MTELDHIAVVAPDLATGVAWVRECLGVEPQRGGAHPTMGTHNHLLRLGDDIFLEVICVDPAAPRPPHPRWFGLDDHAALERNWREGRRLRAYVARCSGVAETIAGEGATFGVPAPLERGELRWTFGVRPDGALPLDGALPHVMDWGRLGKLAPILPESGLKMRSLLVETPDPETVRAKLDAIGMAGQPEIRRGPAVKLTATIATPAGVRTLT